MVDAERPDAILKIQSGQHRGESFPIPAGGASIGNRDQAEVPLRDPWVSFEHARIGWAGDNWFFEDLGSSNGSYVDKQRIRERTHIDDGSIVHIGRTRCIFKIGATELPSPLGPVILPPPPPDTQQGEATCVGGLRIQLEKALADGLWVVQLEGDIDADAADALREWIKEALNQGLRSVVLSLEQVPYINSTGLGVLIKIHDMLKNQGGGLVLTRVREKVQGPIRMLGLHRVFALEPDVRSAISHFPKVGAMTRQLKRTEMMITVDPSLELPAPPLRAELVAESGSRAGRRWVLGAGESTLGSRLDVKVLLPDPHISWYHARIHVKDGAFWIDDLDSHAGTFVDGKRIAKTALSEGALLRLGDTELRFRLLGEDEGEGRNVPCWLLGQLESGEMRGVVYLRELGDRLELGVACLGILKADSFRVTAWLLVREQPASPLDRRAGDPRFELNCCDRPLLQRFEALDRASLEGVAGVCVELAGELYSFALGRPAERQPRQPCRACLNDACLRA